MKKSYHAPEAESIIIESNIIAASTGSETRSSVPDTGTRSNDSGGWGNIWSN